MTARAADVRTRTVTGERAQRFGGAPLTRSGKRAPADATCPHCGAAARVIGRSEHLPVFYVCCDDCGRASIAPTGESQ